MWLGEAVSLKNILGVRQREVCAVMKSQSTCTLAEVWLPSLALPPATKILTTAFI
jgi:hypothetical protein